MRARAEAGLFARAIPVIMDAKKKVRVLGLPV